MGKMKEKKKKKEERKNEEEQLSLQAGVVEGKGKRREKGRRDEIN